MYLFKEYLKLVLLQLQLLQQQGIVSLGIAGLLKSLHEHLADVIRITVLVQDYVSHVLHLTLGLEDLLIEVQLHHNMLGRGQTRDSGYLRALGMLLDAEAAQEVREPWS